MNEYENLKVEFRIPISANPTYMMMLRYLVESAMEFGGRLVHKARFVISVSQDQNYIDMQQEYPWIKEFDIQFRWVDKEVFDKYEYHGTGVDRYYVQSNADIVIMCDADILITGDLDEIIFRSFTEQKRLGLIAFVSPFNKPNLTHKTSKEWWTHLYEIAGLKQPDLVQCHSDEIEKDSNDPSSQYCPYYFNYGFVIAPRKFFDMMSEVYQQELEHILKEIDTIFMSQIAATMSCDRLNIPCGTLSINYNYPTVQEGLDYEYLTPENEGSFPDAIKIFHYWGSRGQFTKNDFKTEQSLHKALTKSNLAISSKFVQQKLKTIHFNIENKITRKNNALKTILIFGTRRSGTTLLQAICCSNNNANELGQECQVLAKLMESYRWSKSTFDSFGLSFFNDLYTLKEFYQTTIEKFIDQLSDFKSKSRLLILRSPEFSKVQNEINELLPNAIKIAILRDPRDQLCSELEVEESKSGSRNQSIHNIHNLLNRYISYAGPILHKVKKNLNNLILIKYEDLVQKPEMTISYIEEKLGFNIPFCPSEFWPRVSTHVGLEATDGINYSSNYGKPISSSAVGRYKKKFSAPELSYINAYINEKLPDLTTILDYKFE